MISKPALRKFTTNCLTTALAITFSSGSAVGSDGVGSSSSIERAGLTREWFTQINVGSRSEIVNMQLQVNEDLSTRYFLVEYGGQVERISQYDLDAFGQPRGIEGAEKFANTRKEILLAELASQQRSNIEVKIRPISLPQTTIYTATSRGHVTAVDADTGRHLWNTAIGNPRYFTSGVGASKTHIAVVNGSTLYCLSASDGKTLWAKKCKRAPSAAPSVSEYSIYVPLTNGRLEVFSLEDRGAYPKSFISFGSAVAKPLVTDSTVSWATSKGFYSIAPFGSRSTKFRVTTGSNLVAGGVAESGMIYINTTGGSVFALDEMRGSILWEYSTGDRITSAPFAKSGSVFAISAEHRMYKIDSARGRPAEGWEKPLEGISRYVSAGRDRIYLLDSLGQLIVINRETGTRVASVPGIEFTMVVANDQTDRLYIGSRSGLLQCYREEGNTYPIFDANEGELMADPEKSDMKDAEAEPEDDPFGDDPFADESDPFAEDSGSDVEDDPFAADSSSDDQDDPFDTDDSSNEDDPFSSDDNDNDNDNDNDSDDDPFGG